MLFHPIGWTKLFQNYINWDDSMFFKIKHEIKYKYTGEVFIEPLTVRLRPRSDCWQKLHQFHLNIDPAPQGTTDFLDLDGNLATTIWNSQLSDYLYIIANSIVETTHTNPFDFILTEDDLYNLPINYPKLLEKSLTPYLEREYTAEEVDIFTQDIIKKSGTNTIAFLTSLNLRIFEEFAKEVRHSGAPLKPIDTLTNEAGSCRDLAVLFIDACRSVGLGARFTSGYFHGDLEDSERQLHAWVEVYLPGGGWRGYDPTHGLAVADRHVAIASSGDPALVAPTTGMFRGTGVSATLDYKVLIQTANNLETLQVI